MQFFRKKRFEELKEFYGKHDLMVFWANLLTLSLALSIILMWGLNMYSLPKHIPLLYSLPWGEKQFISISQIVILPAIIILMVLANTVLSWHLHPSQYVIKRMLAFTTVAVSVLLSITIYKIFFVFI